MRNHWIILIGAALLATNGLPGLHAQYAPTETVPDELRPGFDMISAEQCEEWLTLLAGPKFNGRGSGQIGYTKAAHWISGKLAEWGLEPMGAGGSYFQSLPMIRQIPVASESKIEGPGDLVIEGEDDLGFQRYADQPQVSGRIVFVSIAGQEPQLDPRVSLRDKIVILRAAEGAGFTAQRLIARQQPLAVVTISSDKPRNTSQVMRGNRRGSSSIWCSISEDAAQRLIEAVGADESLIAMPEQAGVSVSDVAAELKITVRLREEKLVLPNVVAWLEGSDPTVSDEYIVLGAHLDHLGLRGDSVYPGADDNGSGSTAILNVAKAMSQNPIRPRRSVMFIWFAAEEVGLVGSRHFVDNPTRSLDKCICMFNTDMVGRNEETREETAAENEGSIHLVGSRRGETGLHEIIMVANQYVGFRFEYDQEGVFGRSDQANFYRAGIPVAFLFGGFHPDYHQPSDTVEKINFKKVESAAKLFYMSIFAASEHGPFKPIATDE